MCIGTWQTVPTQMPINPIHTALLSNGKILVVSGSGNYPAQTIYNVGVWDPSNKHHNHSNAELGHVLQRNDRVARWPTIYYGRQSSVRPLLWLESGPPFTTPRPSARNPIYVDMEDMAHGRWYPTSTVLGDGRVLIFSGLDETERNESPNGNLHRWCWMGGASHRTLDPATLSAHASFAKR